VVKVIWYKAASPLQTDDSIVFARWRQWVLPWRHIGANPQNYPFPRGSVLPSNSSSLGPPDSTSQNGISIGSAVFAQLTTESPYTLQWTSLSPKIALFHGGSGPTISHLIHDSLGPSESITQTASRSVQPVLHKWPQCPYTLQWATPSPIKIAPSHAGCRPHLTHGSFGPPEFSTQTLSRLVQPFLQGSVEWQTDRQTDRPCYLVGNSRPHLRT